MGDKSSIEWLQGGATWNPIRARRKTPIYRTDGSDEVIFDKKGWACVHISPGCVNCYAEKQNTQCGKNPTRAGTGLEYNVPNLSQVEIYLDEKTLLQPLHWKRGRLIFPCSMTDWMADFVPDEFRDKMLAVMALTPQHTYFSLTKRADRQREYVAKNSTGGHIFHVAGQIGVPMSGAWPLPNLWLGVSAENQKYADERIPLLLQTPATVRWVSAEPLLGPIDLCRLKIPNESFRQEMVCPSGRMTKAAIDWIVGGGESGPKARPMHPDWARTIRDQCGAAGVPFFFKQHGQYEPVTPLYEGRNEEAENGRGKLEMVDTQGHIWTVHDGQPTDPRTWLMERVGKKAAGRLLDGREWNEYPERPTP